MKSKLIQVIETEDSEGNLSLYLLDGTPLMQSVVMERYQKMQDWLEEYSASALPNTYQEKLLFARAQMIIEGKIDSKELRGIYFDWAASEKKMPLQA